MCSTQRSPPSFPVCADNRYFFGALCKLLRVAAVPPVVAFFCGIRGLGSRAVFFFFPSSCLVFKLVLVAEDLGIILIGRL